MFSESHDVGLEDMTKKVEELEAAGPLSELQKIELVGQAKDKETLSYLHGKGVPVNLSSSACLGRETPLEWAAYQLEHPIVDFLAGLPHSDKEMLSAVRCALDGFYDFVKEPEKLPKLAAEGRDLLAVVKALFPRDIKIDDNKLFRYTDDRFQYMLKTMRSAKPQQGMPEAMEMLRQTLLFLNQRRIVHQKYAISAAQEGDLVGVQQHWNDTSEFNRCEVLASAAVCGFVEICKFAVTGGACVQAHHMSDAALANPAAVAFLVKHVCEIRERPALVEMSLEMAIARDRVDSLAAILDVLPAGGKAVIRDIPVLRYATLYMAKGCFKLLLERGAPPYYMWYDRYTAGDNPPVHALFSVMSDVDDDFFMMGGEGSAEDLNNKARPASPALFI
jgi:hypothetical protein